MPFNGSGVFQRVRNWVADATAGIKIRADYHDSEDDGFAAGLTNCITKDGQTLITQNIPFNSKRITGLADPINPQDGSTKAYADTKVSKTGSNTMDGNLSIIKNDPILVLDDTVAGGGAGVQGNVQGLSRWLMRLGDGSTESGGNTGSDFDLNRYADGGSFLGRPLVFNRATGLGTVEANPTAALGIATKQYVDATASSAASSAAGARVAKSGDTMTGALTTSGGGGGITSGAVSGSLNVMNTPGVPQAYMTFYAPSFIGSNFGLAEDGNFYMGGMSHGAVAYKFWTTRDFAAVPTVVEIAALRARIEALEAKGT